MALSYLLEIALVPMIQNDKMPQISTLNLLKCSRIILLVFKFDIVQKRFIMDRRNMEKIQPSKGSQYKQTQLFGYKGPGQKVLQEDIITVLKYDHSGRHLALGDQAGRIIIFKEGSNKKEENLEYLTEFQAHCKQFDALRSMEVEEGITGISWLPNQGKYMKLLTSNSKTIKVWKVFEKAEKKMVRGAGRQLHIPKLQPTDTFLAAKTLTTFPNKHHSAINSIGNSQNQEYMLSSDDIHCLLWNFQRPDVPYQLIDITGGKKAEDAEQSINFSKMHPNSDSLFMYGSNKGSLKLCDLRIGSNAQANSVDFRSEYAGNKNFLASMLSSYSSADFTKQGKYIVSRDYLTVKIWDICNSKKPVTSVTLNDSFKTKLSQMFENQSIFDKFTIRASPDGNTVASGSYNNCFHLVDQDGTNTQYELNYKKMTIGRQMGKGAGVGKMEYMKKSTALDYHPSRNVLAVASMNCFFLYAQ